jgi:hypothetical protein
MNKLAAPSCAPSRGRRAILKTLASKDGSLIFHGTSGTYRADEILCAKNARLFPWLKSGHDVC